MNGETFYIDPEKLAAVLIEQDALAAFYAEHGLFGYTKGGQ